jgi:radical SAM superfamily enzyme YgiQ (UPF0313 family)
VKKPAILLVKSRSLVSKNSGTTPPLGLLYIAAFLRARLGAEVRVIDSFLEKDPLKAVRAALRSFSPDVVGISALTAEALLAAHIAAAIKAGAPGLPVIIGGPHPSSDPDLALTDPNVDAAVIGEGEETFAGLVRVIMSEGPRWRDPAVLRTVAGLAFRGGNGLELSAPRPAIEDLDSLPFPAWDLIDYRRFWSRPGMATVGIRPYLPMFTSRGCPYGCVFCHRLFGKKFRARSPENVADEIAGLLRMGAADIEVLDDIANFDKGRFDGILETLLKRGLHPILSFPNALRADLLERDSVALLKKVGAGEVSVAVETVSPRLQKLIGKNLSIEKTAGAISSLAANRIFTRGFFMLGFPTETEEEMISTIKFARSSPLHLALFFTPIPFRNTGLCEMFKKAGKIEASDNTIDYEYYGSLFNGSLVPDKRYRALYRRAYYNFYSSPSRALRILRDRPRLGDAPSRVWLLIRNITSFRRLKEPCQNNLSVRNTGA